MTRRGWVSPGTTLAAASVTRGFDGAQHGRWEREGIAK